MSDLTSTPAFSFSPMCCTVYYSSVVVVAAIVARNYSLFAVIFKCLNFEIGKTFVYRALVEYMYIESFYIILSTGKFFLLLFITTV